MPVQSVDVCIVGGGMVGLAAAAFIHKRHPETTLEILDSQEIKAKDDGKSVVFSAASVSLLKSVNAWPAANTRPIRHIEVSFSGAPAELCLNDDNQVLGYGASHHAVHYQLLEQFNLTAPATVENIEESANGALISIRNKKTLRRLHAKLVIVSCQTALPEHFKKSFYNYRQAVIAGKACAKYWPDNCAFEKFTTRGLVTLVPRSDKEWPVGFIVCATTVAGGEINALPNDEFSAWLNDEFGGRFGLTTAVKRFVYAPRLYRVRPQAAGAVVCIGGGATLLHPVGAQALNLGLADADDLATHWEKGQLHAEKFSRRRLTAHNKAIAVTSLLALGARFRSRPFRLAYGLTASFLPLIPPLCRKRCLALIKP